MEQGVKKTKGQLFAKIVWIVGAAFVAIVTIGTFIDLKNGITINSVCTCVKMIL